MKGGPALIGRPRPLSNNALISGFAKSPKLARVPIQVSYLYGLSCIYEVLRFQVCSSFGVGARTFNNNNIVTPMEDPTFMQKCNSPQDLIALSKTG